MLLLLLEEVVDGILLEGRLLKEQEDGVIHPKLGLLPLNQVIQHGEIMQSHPKTTEEDGETMKILDLHFEVYLSSILMRQFNIAIEN